MVDQPGLSRLTQAGSIGRSSSGSSSLRRRSLSISGAASFRIDDDTENRSVSEAGDIGDRALHSGRLSDAGGSLRLSLDNGLENGAVHSIPENQLLESYGFWSHNQVARNEVSPVSPLPEEIISPLSTDALKEPENKQQVEQKTLPLSLEYASCLVYLAVFGILGVLTRYLLQKLFGPGVAGVTSDWSILYLDLPSNMVGSFLMGWFGVVFKADIAKASDHLAIALTTGYLGSLTTFSGWNQKMLDLSVSGQWVFAVLGFLIGLFLAAYSIIFGIETAKGFRWLLNKRNTNPGKENQVGDGVWKTNGCRHHVAGMLAMLLVLGALWSLSAVMLKDNFSNGGSGAQLWLACLVGPVGVWIRWFLARLNGRGLGKAGILKWIPFGTLIANVSAAVVMAALATIKKAVNSERCDTVASGLQFGLMGCLSTVSTFIAEFHAMRESKHPWRAYVYAVMTVVLSFAFGILVYDVPVWTEGYDHN